MTAALKARPTIYNGIPMRSRLEARVASWFDSLGQVWEYEPSAFASSSGQYLPDFLWPSSSIVPNIYWEIKPTMDHLDGALSRMEVIWKSDPDAFLAAADAQSLESTGMLLLRDAKTEWQGRYFTVCPCKTLLWAKCRLTGDRGDPWFWSYCSRCDDETLRPRRAILRLPGYADQVA